VKKKCGHHMPANHTTAQWLGHFGFQKANSEYGYEYLFLKKRKLNSE
jgi:hypothetical protein